MEDQHHNLTITSKEEAYAFLAYMVHHNEEHSEELADFINYLNESGNKEVASLLEEALVDFVSSNNKLAKALEALK